MATEGRVGLRLLQRIARTEGRRRIFVELGTGPKATLGRIGGVCFHLMEMGRIVISEGQLSARCGRACLGAEWEGNVGCGGWIPYCPKRESGRMSDKKSTCPETVVKRCVAVGLL